MKYRIKFDEKRGTLGFENKKNLNHIKNLVLKDGDFDMIEKVAIKMQDYNIKLKGYKKCNNEFENNNFLWYIGDKVNIYLEYKGNKSVETYLVIDISGMEYSRPLVEIEKVTDEYIEFKDEKIEYAFRN